MQCNYRTIDTACDVRLLSANLYACRDLYMCVCLSFKHIYIHIYTHILADVYKVDLIDY